MGRAMTRLSDVMAWTTMRGALSRATAWRIHPEACMTMPASQTGLRRIWISHGASPLS